jgi:hypothetical protein
MQIFIQSGSSAGYLPRSIIYAAWVGLILNVQYNILPLCTLGLLTTAYCFGVCLEMLPIPAAGFVAALLLNHNISG